MGLHVKYLIFVLLEFSRQILDKCENISFNENTPIGAEFFHADGRTDRRTDRNNEANSRFSQFCDSA